ncbi:Aste57867_22161 [Aphanomyces stellatus]|uniref:Aste57867_22161 protein n=1 Tax=Aphanomyces stellatus TaxID=120398 RepID=A0A485LJN2_9STRA|nr:hypothetical protein As57867_022092 [Aphanomyces stellatus]VFT98828.1 Aste57867_22161 [Aphanomyces stellatus]
MAAYENPSNHLARLEQSVHDMFLDQPLNVEELVRVCEELELFTWSTNVAPMSPDYYAIFLAGLLALRELDRARHLWRRLPVKNVGGLPEIWAVGQALWKREVGQAYRAIAAIEALSLGPEVQAVVAVLKTSIGAYNVSLLGRAYSSVPVAVVSQALGLSPDDTLQFCASQQWPVTGDFAFPTKVSAPSRHAESAAELEQLQKLSSYILHLEQRTTLKI